MLGVTFHVSVSIRVGCISKSIFLYLAQRTFLFAQKNRVYCDDGWKVMMISQEVSPSSLLSPPTFPESQLTHETILKCDYRSLAILEKLLHVIASDSAYVAKCNNFVISRARLSFYVSKRRARERYIVDCPMSGTHSSFTLIYPRALFDSISRHY